MRGHWVVPKLGTVVDTTSNPNHPTMRAVCSACDQPVVLVNKVKDHRRQTWRHLREATH